MSGRVLNFFEFSDKYSTGNSDPLGVDNMTSASSNFEEGFDDTTYDQPELGPKRPVSGNYEATPAGPGEGSVPAFSQGERPGMNPPEEEEEDDFEDDAEEVEEDDDDSGNPEGDETEEDETEEEKVEESFRLVKSFSRFLNESYDGYYGEDEDSGEDYGANPDDYFGYGANPDEDEYGMYPEDEDEYGMYPEEDYYSEEEEQFCSNCGAMGDEYGYSCGCNM
jgi:hypothetical protein